MTSDAPASDLPTCDGPDPDTRKPDFVAPPRACDSHAHVFGPRDAFPYDPGRAYDPPEAPYEAFRGMLDVLGVERGVLVQPNVHGHDNSAILDAVARSGGNMRAIGMVPSDVDEAEIARLNDAGMRGLRINLQFDGMAALDGIEGLAERIKPFGWHLQFLADISNFHEALPRLGALTDLGVDILFDHLGHMPVGLGLDAAPFQDMLGLMRAGGCWVKLSGPYRTTAQQGVPFADTRPFVDALLETAPDNLIWGTDWPHPHLTVPMVNDGDLLDLLAGWVPDDGIRHRVLVDNPARLFGFSA